MQTRSQTRAGKAPPKKICKVVRLMNLPLPIPMATRTRLYKIVKGNLVVNAEGHQFRLPPDDYVVVGSVTRKEQVTRESMTKLAHNIGGYFHISFIKADGTLRSMYAHVNGSVYNGNTLRLVDLEAPASEYRCCCVDRISSITRGGVHYYV